MIPIWGVINGDIRKQEDLIDLVSSQKEEIVEELDKQKFILDNQQSKVKTLETKAETSSYLISKEQYDRTQEDLAIKKSVTNEVNARKAGDTELLTKINTINDETIPNEEAARQEADSALDERISDIENNFTSRVDSRVELLKTSLDVPETKLIIKDKDSAGNVVDIKINNSIREVDGKIELSNTYTSLGTSATKSEEYFTSKIDQAVDHADAAVEEAKEEITGLLAVETASREREDASIQADLDFHINDIHPHITNEERESWNNKSEFSGQYADLKNVPTDLVHVQEMRQELNQLQPKLVAGENMTIRGNVISAKKDNYVAGNNIIITNMDDNKVISTEDYLNTRWGLIYGNISDNPQLTTALNSKMNNKTFARVADTGDYNDLSNRPSIPDITNLATKLEVNRGLAAKQNTLISGTSIKTINNQSILGTGNIVVTATGDYATKAELRTVESIAKGRSAGYVFSTKSALDAWLADSAHVASLNLGDNLYIRDINTPDYWWDGTTIQPLETQKVDLSEYAKISDLSGYAKTTDLASYALASSIPTKVSDLTNDSDFVDSVALNLSLEDLRRQINSDIINAIEGAY